VSRKKAQEALKLNEEQFRRAIEDAPIPTIMHAEDGQVLLISRTWTELTGYRINDIPDFDIWLTKVAYGEGANEVRDHMHKLFEGHEKSLNVEFPIRALDGGIKYWSFSASSPGTLRDGRRFIIGMAVDITDRKRNEKTISDLAKFPLENPAAVLRVNRQGIVMYANPVAHSFLNHWQTKVGERAPDRIRKMVVDSLASNDKTEFEENIGEEIYAFLLAPIVSEDYANLYGRGVTRRKKAEEASKETRCDLNRAQAVGKIGSWRLDTQHNVLLWSDENHRIFGVSKGTPMTYEAFLSIVHPDDREYVDKKWKAGLLGEPYDIEHRIIVDGKVKWVREKAELEFDEKRNLLGGFGTTQEITEVVEMRSKLEFYSKNLEDLVNQKTKQLKDAERLAAIGATAGMVGHDIRNPLQGIIGDIYLAKADLSSMPQSDEKTSLQESLEAIMKNTEYINKIVTDLQDFAKPINPCAEETNLKAIIDALTRKSGLPENIQAEIEVDWKARRVMADSAFVKRILGNLVNNAVQAMPNGGKLTIQTRRDAEDVILTVEDTGVGIPEEAKAKLFTPLFTTKSKGQGFGLAVVKRMTEALGGSVTFESKVGKGTKFIVRLPPPKK
jgi:PAS domain S-box-containing protein